MAPGEDILASTTGRLCLFKVTSYLAFLQQSLVKKIRILQKCWFESARKLELMFRPRNLKLSWYDEATCTCASTATLVKFYF
jgi:hypothetical protein